MPSGRDIYSNNSKWLKADNLGDDEATFTVTGSGIATFREKDGSEKQQITLTFRETEKEFGLNVTNFRALESIFKSDETEDWEGNKVVLFVTQTTSSDGREVDCLRIKKKATEKLYQDRLNQIRKASTTPTGPAPKGADLIRNKPVTQEEVDADEDIPF